MPINPKPPQGINPTPFTPAGTPEPQIFETFDGINTSTTRPGVKDEQMWWADGFMPIGPRFLRTLPGKGPELFNAGGFASSIAFFDFVDILGGSYMITILANGSVIATQVSTGASIGLSGVGTIQNPSRLTVGMTAYGARYAIIVAQQTNGYFIWDGGTFYVPGAPSPFSGTMPTGIGGSAVETYQGRVWVANQAQIAFTAPGSGSDFSSGNGGGSFLSTDSFLRARFTGLKQTNGFLYLIADSSVNYISGVQTSGSPPVTTFTNQNADPEIGTPWGSTAMVFSRNIIFANSFGVHVSYGGAVTKVSDALDGIFNSVPDFGSFVPSSAKAIIFGKKIYMLLVPIIDPISGQEVTKLLMWDGKRWFASGQDLDMTYIQFQESNSVLTAYGTDGTVIYPLFRVPTVGFTKTVQSKLWDKPGNIAFTKASSRLWGMFRYYSSDSPELRISIDNETGGEESEFDLGPLDFQWLNNNDAEIQWLNNANAAIEWTSAQNGIVVLDAEAIAQNGVLTGLTVQTEAADMAIIQLMIKNELVDYRG